LRPSLQDVPALAELLAVVWVQEGVVTLLLIRSSGWGCSLGGGREGRRRRRRYCMRKGRCGFLSSDCEPLE
jgi:hypothetical protein